MKDITAGREVVIKRSTVTAIVGVIVALAALFGLPLDPGTQEALTNVLLLGLPLVLPLIAGFWSRKGVTPVMDPRGMDGEPLIPAGEVAAPGDEDETMYADETEPERPAFVEVA